MKAQYIKQVKKHLQVSGNAKKEIVRDLEEIFSSAAEHDETEAAVIERLGEPEKYAAEANRAFGCENKGKSSIVGMIIKVLVAAVALVFTVYCVILYNLTRSPMFSAGIIGGSDGPTTIILTNPNTPGGGGIFLIFAGVALILFVLMLVSLVRSKRKCG